MQGFELDRLYLTHFGEFRDVDRHLADLGPNLDEFLQIGTEATRCRGRTGRADARACTSGWTQGVGDVHPGVLVNLEWATPSYMATLGLIRWHKKQREAQGS